MPPPRITRLGPLAPDQQDPATIAAWVRQRHRCWVDVTRPLPADSDINCRVSEGCTGHTAQFDPRAVGDPGDWHVVADAAGETAVVMGSDHPRVTVLGRLTMLVHWQ